MNAAHYAEALYQAHAEHPHKSKELLSNLRRALRARGHEKLLPKIYHEYERLCIKAKRAAQYAATTPEQERTRILLELYRRLINTH